MTSEIPAPFLSNDLCLTLTLKFRGTFLCGFLIVVAFPVLEPKFSIHWLPRRLHILKAWLSRNVTQFLWFGSSALLILHVRLVLRSRDNSRWQIHGFTFKDCG